MSIVERARSAPIATPFFRELAAFDEGLIKNWPTATLCIALAVFVVIAAFSGIDAIGALGACCALVVGVVFLLPRTGMLLVVCCVPIQWVFDLSREEMRLYIGFALVSVAMRHLHEVPGFLRQRPPPTVLIPCALAAVIALWTIAAFAASHPIENEAVVECLFFAALFVAAIAAFRYAASPEFRSALIMAIALSLIITVSVDVVRTYASTSTDTSLSSALASLRLAGLHVNPNATAKYVLLGLAFASVWLWLSWSPRAVAPVVVAAAGMFALSATMSKGALIGFVGALGLTLVHSVIRRPWRSSLRMAATIVFLIGLTGVWELAVYPLVRDSAVARFSTESAGAHAAKQDAAATNAAAAAPRRSVLSAVKRDFRVDQSYAMRVEPERRPAAKSEMYRGIEGKIDYVKRNCGWTCAGQRDRLWAAGLETVRHHWLFGIGPAPWQGQMQHLLGFPFDSPHNVILELWGRFGLAGLALCLACWWFVLRLSWAALGTQTNAREQVFAIGSALYLVAMLVTELFDPAKYLGLSPHTIWLWIVVGALSRTVARSAVGDKASP